MSKTTQERPRNLLLRAIPRAELTRLRRHMELVDIEVKTVLWQPDEPIDHVYFPESGVLSVVAVLKDAMIEVATIGREGFLGVPVLLGAASVPVRAMSQIAGRAFRMRTTTFLEETRGEPRVLEVLRLYTQALLNQISQTAACNRGHGIEQRCARWILMTHDRVEEESFLLTQEFLAQMLGVRRAGVSEVERRLQSAGLITFSRGRITVLDRRGLEQAACECYAAIRKGYEQLLGAPTS